MRFEACHAWAIDDDCDCDGAGAGAGDDCGGRCDDGFGVQSCVDENAVPWLQGTHSVARTAKVTKMMHAADADGEDVVLTATIKPASVSCV
jgi:hypothetical protein